MRVWKKHEEEQENLSEGLMYCSLPVFSSCRRNGKMSKKPVKDSENNRCIDESWRKGRKGVFKFRGKKQIAQCVNGMDIYIDAFFLLHGKDRIHEDDTPNRNCRVVRVTNTRHWNENEERNGHPLPLLHFPSKLHSRWEKKRLPNS